MLRLERERRKGADDAAFQSQADSRKAELRARAVQAWRAEQSRRSVRFVHLKISLATMLRRREADPRNRERLPFSADQAEEAAAELHEMLTPDAFFEGGDAQDAEQGPLVVDNNADGDAAVGATVAWVADWLRGPQQPKNARAGTRRSAI